jgi:hypothetical protein
MESRDERIRALAYDIWQRSGRQQGQEMQHWNEAAKIIDEEDSVAAQAPADPGSEGRNRA